MTEAPSQGSLNFGKLLAPALVMALIGGVLCFMQYGQNAEAFYQSYLFGWTVWIVLTCGCLGVMLLSHAVRGSWSVALMRLFEAGGGPTMLILMGVLFLPLLMHGGMHAVYHHWVEPNGDKVVLWKQAFLNPTTFQIATVAYFVIWLAFAAYNRGSTLRQDRTLDPTETAKRINISVLGLILFVLTVTLSQTHWTMSIDPHFFSAIWGVWFLASMALAAISLGTIIVCFNARKQPYQDVVGPKLTKDFGNMMFAFTMFWTYCTFSQFIIIWSGNLYEFTPFFYVRSNGGWAEYGAFLMFFGFFVPWMILLSPGVKANADKLKWVAIIVFGMRIFDVYYLVIPFFRKTPMPMLGDVGALLLIGGIWLAAFSVLVRKQALLPKFDNRLQEALAHEH